MSQVSKQLRLGASGTYIFYCPGCREAHSFPTPRWTFNGNLESPSFTPSLRVFETDAGVEHTLCHLILTDGRIQFCDDSDHHLKGQTVPLPELPDWMQSDKYGDGNP